MTNIILGKKKERNFQSTTKIPKISKGHVDHSKPKMNLYSHTSSMEPTQDQKIEKPLSNHQQKHKKTDNVHKKHTNMTTIKPKTKHESKCLFYLFTSIILVFNFSHNFSCYLLN